MYLNHNKPHTEFTADPKKYPQGFFKVKQCRWCSSEFQPVGPSHLYCCQECSDCGVTSAYLMRTYGISFRDYQRMHEEQGGLCAICKGKGFVMAKHHKLRLVVDHCHSTGVVRGLLCHNCNRGIGLLQDSIPALTEAIRYLKGAETIRKE